MSNPVEKVRAIKSNARVNDFTFPTTLGSDEEKHFTYIIAKEILPGGKQEMRGTIALPMPLDIVDDYALHSGMSRSDFMFKVARQYHYANIKRRRECLTNQ